MSFLSAQQREAMRQAKVFAKGVVVSAEIDGPALSVDVRLAPDDVEVIAEYAPDAAGVFRLPQPGDLVLVAFPGGDFTDGLVIKHIPADGQNAAPEGIAAGTLYVWAPEGENVVVKAAGGGTITIEADTVVCQSSDVRLGGSAAGDQVVTQNRLDAKFNAFKAHYAAHQHSYVTPLIPSGAAPTAPGVPPQTGAPGLTGSSSPDVKAT